jgi:hypothetical protein
MDREALDSNSWRIGVSFVAAYLGGSLLLLAGSHGGFAIVLTVSQVIGLVAVRRRLRTAEGRMTAPGYDRQRLREIVAASVGARRSFAVASPGRGHNPFAVGPVGTVMSAEPLASFGLARRATQSVVAFFAAESDARAAWRDSRTDDLELVRIDWASGDVEYRSLH